ncbi:ESCRT-III subunit protein snf7 [Coemansia pectinata]|uniref:Vacuolar-sorting protein SNF7 n=1 Tax=Coemansia pectinata TaxID=1052879 RepID=A0A9W8GYQ7_9FUNG|nr:ESCRT-III subunit protein snf7 [Coemansia pectinata]
MNLFFAKKKEKTTPKDAIINLRETLTMLEKRELHIQGKIDHELKIARTNATSNRRVALLALKRKKLYDNQLEKMSGTRMTIEAQAMSIEAANVNLETMKAMERGAEAMKHIHKDLNIDKVDQTMEDIREQMDLANEVSDAISQPQLFGAEMDEDELEAELEELEQEELDKQLLNSGRVPVSLPKLPPQTVAARSPTAQPLSQPQPQRNTRPVVEHVDEDDELAELRESMGMAAM